MMNEAHESQEMDDGPDSEVDERKLTIAEILSGDNLVEMLDDQTVMRLGYLVVRDYEIDEGSREDWLKRYDRSLDIAMQVRKAKTFPWPGASNVKYPMLTVAAVQFQARAYPAIVDSSNLVKGRVLGPDPTGEKRERADRMGQHMTWQLLYKMVGWEEATDRLLLMLPITGCVFRKSYYDPIAGTNCSDMVPASDFVVHYMAKSLDAAPRYTHILHLYPYEVRERVKAGLWRDVPLGVPEEGGDDEDGLLRFYEQHRMADLDEDGIPEHYVVTTNTDGVVVRIVPCFAASDVYVRAGEEIKRATDLSEDELALPDHPIVRIERQQYFTKYGFIPSPDGAFYDIGFGTLLDDLTAAIDGTLNRMLDAGTLQNAQGGFLGAGVNIKGGNMKFAIGEWKRVDSGGGALRDSILPLQLPGPSPVLFQLLGMLLDAAKQITSVQDILTGANQGPNTPATTVLAQIEQGQKVMNGIFKRIHRAFGNELRILRRLNRDYLDEEEYFQLNDEDEPEVDEQGQPIQKQPQPIGRADYEDSDLDVVPVSDPTIVSDAQRMAKAQALLPFRGDPLVNQAEIAQRYFEALGVTDIKKLMTPPKPGPNPELLIEGMKQQLEKMKLKIDEMSKRGPASDALMSAATKAAALGLMNDAAALAGAATEIGAMENEQADGQGDVPGMAGPPADAGVPDLLGGPPEGADGGMGAGPSDDGGAAGIGGAPGATGGPVA